MKYLKYILPSLFTLFVAGLAGFVYSAPVSNVFRNLIPESNELYDIGTTTPAAQWKNIYTQNLTVGGTCTGCSIATSTNPLMFTYSVATSTSATSSFAGPLYIASSTPTRSAYFAVGTSSPLLWVDRNSGWVGIGTTSPTSNLVIAGPSLLRLRLTQRQIHRLHKFR